ncbi:MAG: Rieske 2Fe-2S domain-containing protein [Dehalococcoidia bacterium]|nr:Rieske 2Fe-2S domain-containing protein [Dehalococcoidia bacterium]
MGTFVFAVKTSELKDGAMKQVNVQGHDLLIAQVGGKYYAMDNRCLHMGGNLSQGKLEGTVVTCPRHGSQFDLQDGHVVRWLKGSGIVSSMTKALKGDKGLATYKVKTDGSSIMVEI